MKSRNLVIVLVVSCLLLMIGTYAAAQDVNPSVPSLECPRGGSAGEGKQMGGPGEKIKKELSLTDTQVNQLKSLRQKRMAEMKTHMSEVTGKIKAVLTPDQQAQFDLNKERMMSMKKNRRGGKGMHGGPGGMQGGMTPGQGKDTCTGPGTKENPTNMTPGQGESAAGARGAGGGQARGPMNVFFMGTAPTETQKGKIRSIMEAEKAGMKSLKAQRENDMKSILTPEQYKKFEEMKKNMGARGGQQGFGQGRRPGGKRHQQGGGSTGDGI